MDQQHAIEAVARVCHEANRAWCFVNGDASQVEWAEAPAWQRESTIRGVEFALANPDAPDSAQHDAWSADKVRDGWQYGLVKDAQVKTHPCLVPFDQLPAHQQAKDRLFRAIVRALQSVQGILGASYLHARGEGPKSDGSRECASQTQNVSSQRAHFGIITVAPAQDPAALG